jgi:molybdopterin-containing oxidoreductase family iron-sulfur binding subunit
MAARDENRPLRNGDVVPACVQSCPTRAMTFGDMADPSSDVARLARSDRATRLMDDLGTKPKVVYLKGLREG